MHKTCQSTLKSPTFGLSARLIMDHPLRRVSKLRTSCLAEFDKHWNCLERNNQVRGAAQNHATPSAELGYSTQEYYLCRKPEKALNECVFEKLVRTASSQRRYVSS